MVSRTDRSRFAEWWWTIDKFLLIALLALVFGGVVLSFAASPSVADRIGAPTYHFVQRQAAFAIPAIAVMIGVSMLSPRQVRKTAFILYGVMLLLTIATLFFGTEIKGSRRWLNLIGMSIQPTEFLKPAFVILVAYMLDEVGSRRFEIPGKPVAAFILVMTLAPVVAQPDLGQAMLLSIVWCSLFFLAGLPWLWTVMLAGLGATGLAGAYVVFPHVAGRINRFLDPAGKDTFQVDTALDAFQAGGWLGVGPGEGTVKQILPDAHTDFVFAVTAEEFGLIVCMGLVAVFAFVVLRSLSHARDEPDGFVRLGASGLAILFGVQACINIAVNLHLMPAKGMTLPFISYGGSSLVAIGLEMGFLLALTRRRPRIDAALRSPIFLTRRENAA